MSGRDLKPKKSSGRPGFLGRTKAMSSSGSSGWEATTIGFTLVGCIGATSALGYWLDGHFKTNYWLPILFLVGAVAGFREMFVVLGRISKAEAQKKLEKQAQVRLAPSPMPNAPMVPEAPARERTFRVPPPPQPGEEISASQSEGAENEAMKSESVEDLLQRLLQEDRNENESDTTK